uniref:TLC domain-containing protein n=1 Tax=Araucaria cunninghamii TaxID=56994 RepID=A0A0D6QVR7_ARACU
MDFHVLLPSIVLFAALYAFGYFVVFRKWKGKNRFEAASCGISLVHGTITCLASVYDMLHSPWKLDAPNTLLENQIMEFSTAYFVVDLLHYLLVNPSDYLFIFHHFATSFYMLTCMYYTGHGGLSAISLIAAGEATSPLQNVWTVSRMARAESELANRVYTSLSPFFTVYFTFMRCIVGPYVTWNLASFYIAGKADAVIPRWLAYTWMITVFMAIFGSIIWVYKLWAGLIKFYSRKGKVRAQKAD